VHPQQQLAPQLISLTEQFSGPLRRKVLRLAEDQWLVERWIVSMVDLERIVKSSGLHKSSGGGTIRP